MKDLSLHILDIVENSINAGAGRITVKIAESKKNNLLTLEVNDNGRGMDEEMLRNAEDPFYTTRTTRKVGLGLPFLGQAARDSGGEMKIETEKGRGSRVTASFQQDHIDRKPLGDITATITVLVAGNPHIDFIFELSRDDEELIIDTAEMKKELGDIPVNSPDVIRIIKVTINDWLKQTGYVIE
jgi:signal transduction histidine kinase